MELQKKPVIVREVWAENFEYEFSLIEAAIPCHLLISLDTEFPGTVFESDLPRRLISSASPDYIYDLMKRNVDILKIVQLGLTLSDRYGYLPDFGTEASYIWQFNFSDFNIKKDRYDPEAIEMLEKQGINFKKNRRKGIDSRVFGARWVMSSVMSHYKESLTWITFHGGYDVALLIKMLTVRNLPDRLEGLMEGVKFFLGADVYDLKLMAYNLGLHGGLEKLGTTLGVSRIAGKSHEAGSDSLLTTQSFIRFLDLHFHEFNILNYQGKLYGLCSKGDQQHHNYMVPFEIPLHCNFRMFEFYPNHQNYVTFF